jgi:signal transduction histidine kinase
MKHLFAMPVVARRQLTIIGLGLLFCALAVINVIKTDSYAALHPTPTLWLYFGSSFVTSLMFFIIGSLVWFYARDRLAATLLYSFCCAMACVFIVQTGATLNDRLLTLISRIAVTIALTFLLCLLCTFPTNYFKIIYNILIKNDAVYTATTLLILWVVMIYGTVLLCFAPVISLWSLYLFLAKADSASSPMQANTIYLAIGLISAIVVLLFTYFRVSTVRKRQQLRLYVAGLIAAILPVLFLTLLPAILQSDVLPVVDPQLSTLSFILFPLALGYAILRYQILVFDAYIRQAVLWIINGIGTIVLEYLILTLTAPLWLISPDLYILACAVLTALLMPVLLWLVRMGVDRLFFHEMACYRHLSSSAITLTDTPLNLNEVALLITSSLVQTFETTAVCLFVLDEAHRRYYLCPKLTAGSSELARRALVEYVLRESGAREDDATGENDGFARSHPVITRLAAARRPLFLREVMASEPQGPLRAERYIAPISMAQDDNVLLAPVRVQGKMIAVLVLGERGDHQPYAGPDFEVLQEHLARFASLLETARMTLALRAAYERQKELDVLKDQFIMTASHELRTPLTAVKGYIDLLAQYDASLSSEARAGFIQRAQHGCDELVLMVENIMDASRVQVDAVNINLQPILLREPVEHVLEMLGVLLKHSGRAVEVEIAANLVVEADAMRLRQVILNLVNNALKYSPAGTPLKISARRQGAEVVLAVRDYGPGIPCAEQPHLFERFMRLERDMNSSVRGAGLGLYICKQLVEAMGGHIWVESSGQPGEGSAFLFTLRALPARATQPLLPDTAFPSPILPKNTPTLDEKMSISFLP